MTKRRIYGPFLVMIILLGGAGIAASMYTLLHERLSPPFTDTYRVRAEFTAADGIVSGLGQPVDVVGVKVGQITGATLQNGHAVVTMQLDRGVLPQVYANATASLEPVTPLDDMELNLNPGGPPAPGLAPGATIPVGQTAAPAQLSDLLSTLDGDTRAFLTSLITSLGEGTLGRGADIRRILNTLGPTTHEVAKISQALAGRRTALADLVHNVAIVTRSASRDHVLNKVVVAGDETLHAVAAQQASLQQAIAQLPPTLAVTRATLTDLQPFAQKLTPTLDALSPAVRQLPATLRQLTPFARETTSALKNDIRPLVRAAQPLVRPLQPAVANLTAETPSLSGSFQALEYFFNELAYNPNQGDNQGFLFWLDWAAHNLDSAFGFGDANGGLGRAAILANCYGLASLPALQKSLGLVGACPQ